MVAHLIKDEQNPAYDLLSKLMRTILDMANLTDKNRTNQIIKFLESLNIKSNRFKKIISLKDELIIANFDEALTHTSGNKIINYEKLEFFGDAVLRLAASNFIENNYKNMKVGVRSELRSQIVSDEWLTKLGKKINIEKVIIKGAKAVRDENSKDTIIGEATEALIGAIYKCFNSISEINLWLDELWEKDSEEILKAPHKFNAKSILQEWCQKKGLNLPIYRITEISKNHGDLRRFSCEIYINGSKKAASFGPSHKKAEKNAAFDLIEQFISDGKI